MFQTNILEEIKTHISFFNNSFLFVL